jgi:hypothetical protein
MASQTSLAMTQTSRGIKNDRAKPSGSRPPRGVRVELIRAEREYPSWTPAAKADFDTARKEDARLMNLIAIRDKIKRGRSAQSYENHRERLYRSAIISGNALHFGQFRTWAGRMGSDHETLLDRENGKRIHRSG